MIAKVSSTKNGQMVYYFSNGVVLSMIWSWGSYTENHGSKRYYDLISNGEFAKAQLLEWESVTVEVYSMGADNGIVGYLGNKYGGNPAGYVPVSDIPKILRRADKEQRSA